MKIANKRELRQLAFNHLSETDFKDFMKLYKDYTKESYSQRCHQIIHQDLGTTYYKMTATEKIKAINKKIEQRKAQINLDRQTAKISALSSGNISKYKFLTGKDVLPEKDLLEKAAAIKRFNQYSLLN